MDLPLQYVPTTDNLWLSEAIMILLMSLHSKAFQQSPTAELILSPSPIHEDAPASNHHELASVTWLNPFLVLGSFF